MERTSEPIVYIDTHIVVWLFEKQLKKFSPSTLDILEKNQILISPMVALELEFLNEVKKIKHHAKDIISELTFTIGLEITHSNFHHIIEHAINFEWTRDPFDRIIVAEASTYNATLITHDKTILTHYKKARP
jgi:PIN domain nuclease of toxin-antitoxin system